MHEDAELLPRRNPWLFHRKKVKLAAIVQTLFLLNDLINEHIFNTQTMHPTEIERE